jgi:hypothetical protein
MHLTPEQRVLRARIAAHTRWANEDAAGRLANAQRAREGFGRRFLDQVDPNRVLPEAERQRRAESAMRAYMAQLALKSSKARGARKRRSAV